MQNAINAPETEYFDRQTVSHTCLATWATDFDLLDARGRRIGYRFSLYQIETRPRTEEDAKAMRGFSRYTFPDLSHYSIKTSVTRNGKDFGASTSSVTSPSLREALAGAKVRAERAKARYAKELASA